MGGALSRTAVVWAFLGLGACSSPARAPDAPPEAQTSAASAPIASAGPPASAIATAPPASEAGSRVELTLTVRPKPVMTSAESAEFRLELEVRNPGTLPVKPELERSTLYVNDKPFKPWNEAIEPAAKSEAWRELGPGKSLTFSFRFQKNKPVKSGSYRFVLQSGPNKSAPVDMRVE